jgi:hypothetical protein
MVRMTLWRIMIRTAEPLYVLAEQQTLREKCIHNWLTVHRHRFEVNQTRNVCNRHKQTTLDTRAGPFLKKNPQISFLHAVKCSGS